MVVDKELTRILTLLRNKIRERGFTQLEVQDALGWGRSYISQLLTKQKSLRVEQVLMILNVIEVDPVEFFGELYHFRQVDSGIRNLDDYVDRAAVSGMPSGHGLDSGVASVPANLELQQASHNMQELKSMLHGLVQILLDKNIVKVDELSEAVKESEQSLKEESANRQSSASLH